jgi:hypothetical protein
VIGGGDEVLVDVDVTDFCRPRFLVGSDSEKGNRVPDGKASEERSGLLGVLRRRQHRIGTYFYLQHEAYQH